MEWLIVSLTVAVGIAIILLCIVIILLCIVLRCWYRSNKRGEMRRRDEQEKFDRSSLRGGQKRKRRGAKRRKGEGNLNIVT